MKENSSLKNFIAIFACAENSTNHQAWMKLSSEEKEDRLKNGNLAMEKWNQKYQDQIVSNGSDLGSVTLKVGGNGIKEVPSQMGGFLVIKANSLQDAAQIFLDHPHFSIFPGDSVDILECVETRN